MTLSGLSGAVLNQSVPLISELSAHAFCQMNPVTDEAETGLGTWDSVIKSLRFTVCAGIELTSNTSYRVSFDVVNPLVAQSSPGGISLEGSGVIEFLPLLLGKTNEEILGVIPTLDPKPQTHNPQP